MDALFEKLKQTITAADTIAVVCHQRPDADALGALGACVKHLRSLGKEAYGYCLDEIPSTLYFLPYLDDVKHEIDDCFETASLYLVIDSSDLRITGVPASALAGKPVAVIDHHVSNIGYGSLNVVQHRASATAQIVYEYFSFINYSIDKASATCLLAGIYTDTDAFSNLATTPASLSAASELLKLGGNLREITANTMQNKSIASLKLWGRALERLRLDKEKGIAVTVIKQDDVAECQARPEDMEGVANLLNHLADVKMAMVLREQTDGTVKGSLRTTNELIDVSKVATLLGGGGHAKAAGFTVAGRIVETEQGWKIVE